MKNLKTTLLALLITFGTAFAFTSCEEEEVLPGDREIIVRGSGDAGGMEDEGQFD